MKGTQDQFPAGELDVSESYPAYEGDEDDLNEVLKLMGVSVHWLENGFLKEVEAAGWDRTATIGELEGLEIEEKPQPKPYYLQGIEDDDDEKSGDKKPKRPTGTPIILERGNEVLCPLDGHMGAAYVHCLTNKKGKVPMVGVANIYLIYTNKYSIGDIVDTLMDYCNSNGLDPKDLFVWMYCFSANLHRITRILFQQEHDIMEMMHAYEEIKKRVSLIGHIMPILTPWQDPLLLKRSWCSLELYAARQVQKEQEENYGETSLEISVVLPPSQKMNLETNVLGEPPKAKGTVLAKFYKVIGGVKVQEAHAALYRHRNGILMLVEDHMNGRPHYNLQVNGVTRQWYRALRDELEQLPQHAIPQKFPIKPLTVWTTNLLAGQYADYFDQLAGMFDNNDEPEAAEEMRERAQSIRELIEQDDQGQTQLIPEKPLTYYNAHAKLAQREDWDGAILALGKTMAIMEAAYGTQHIATGSVYHRIGDMLLQKSKTDPASKQGAMIAYKRALDVQEIRLGKLHPITCTNYIRLGLYLESRGQFDQALEYYTNGQMILGAETALAIKTFIALERKFLANKDLAGAEAASLKGQVIRDCLGIQLREYQEGEDPRLAAEMTDREETEREDDLVRPAEPMQDSDTEAEDPAKQTEESETETDDFKGKQPGPEADEQRDQNNIAVTVIVATDDDESSADGVEC